MLALKIVLGIILSITIISVNNVLSNSKDTLSDTQKNNVEKAAQAYYIEEGMNENKTCVNISDLINKGYIESKKVIDPKTRENLPGSVKINSENNQYSYEYQSIECE